MRNTFDECIDEASHLSKTYSDKIDLLVGPETDYITTLDLDNLFELLKKHGNKIDYVVGSIHHINKSPIDFDQITYEKSLASFQQSDSSPASALEGFLTDYFDVQYGPFFRSEWAF